MPLFFTYILLCADNRYYTGITDNMSRRLHQHSTGQSKSTRWHLPISLVYHYIHYDRRAARRMEVKIKNRGAKNWLNYLKFNHNGTG